MGGDEDGAWRLIKGINGDIGPVGRTVEAGDVDVKDAGPFDDAFP